MKIRAKLRWMLSAAAVFILMCCMSIAVYAETPSFTYSYPVDGVQFRLYKIGEVQDDEFVLTGDYAGYAVDLNEKTAAETLATYVERDGLQAIDSQTTASGSVCFNNLDQAIYLLLGDTVTVDKVKWTPSAVLFSVPQKDDNGTLIWDITAGGKYTREEIPDPQTITIPVQKVWQDSGYETKLPSSINVQLLKDGKVYDTQKLSDSNNWKYTWKDLDASADWTVTEESVPSGYTVSITTTDGVKVIVNTYEKTIVTPTPTPTPVIPYTGQLWWPVGLLIVGGLALVLVGLIRRKRDED